MNRRYVMGFEKNGIVVHICRYLLGCLMRVMGE